MTASVNTIIVLVNFDPEPSCPWRLQRWRSLEISDKSPYRAALAKEGKGDSENIDFREFQALFRARVSTAGREKML